MKLEIVSWNVNSVRARLPHLLKFITENAPDVLCLQETKVQDEQFPREEFEALGYKVYAHGQKAYNGVAFISKYAIADIQHGFPEGDMEGQARVICGTLADFDIHLVNVYCPQGESPDSPKYAMKRRFYARLTELMMPEFLEENQVLLCGDLNIAPESQDVHNPATAAKKCMFLPEEREWLQTLTDQGFCDSFRQFNDQPNIYSWWDYRSDGFATDRGMRIDHILLSDSLAESAVDAKIYREPRGWERPSDHTVVSVVFTINSKI